MVTYVIKWHQKCQIKDNQTKDRLSVCRPLILQQKPKLGRTKLSTGPHAARGSDIAVRARHFLQSSSVIRNVVQVDHQ